MLRCGLPGEGACTRGLTDVVQGLPFLFDEQPNGHLLAGGGEPLLRRRPGGFQGTARLCASAQPPARNPWGLQMTLPVAHAEARAERRPRSDGWVVGAHVDGKGLAGGSQIKVRRYRRWRRPGARRSGRNRVRRSRGLAPAPPRCRSYLGSCDMSTRDEGASGGSGA